MPIARSTDPITSHEAADSVKNLTATKRMILAILSNVAMTDEALIAEYRFQQAHGLCPMASDSGIRSRRHELFAQGLLEAVGFEKTASNRRALVWSAK